MGSNYFKTKFLLIYYLKFIKVIGYLRIENRGCRMGLRLPIQGWMPGLRLQSFSINWTNVRKKIFKIGLTGTPLFKRSRSQDISFLRMKFFSISHTGFLPSNANSYQTVLDFWPQVTFYDLVIPFIRKLTSFWYTIYPLLIRFEIWP